MTTPYARMGLTSDTILTIRQHSDQQHTRALAMHDQEKASQTDKEDVRFLGDTANLALIGTYMALGEDTDDPQPIPAEAIHLPCVFEYKAPAISMMGLNAWTVLDGNMIVGPFTIHMNRLPIYQAYTPEHVAVNAAIRASIPRFVETIERLESKRERIQAIAQRGNAAQELGRLVEFFAKEEKT